MDPLDEEPKDDQAGRDGKPKPDRDSETHRNPPRKIRILLQTNGVREMIRISRPSFQSIGELTPWSPWKIIYSRTLWRIKALIGVKNRRETA
jgi:hypothetical protein